MHQADKSLIKWTMVTALRAWMTSGNLSRSHLLHAGAVWMRPACMISIYVKAAQHTCASGFTAHIQVRAHVKVDLPKSARVNQKTLTSFSMSPLWSTMPFGEYTRHYLPFKVCLTNCLELYSNVHRELGQKVLFLRDRQQTFHRQKMDKCAANLSFFSDYVTGIRFMTAV